jgi:prolyl-tRNA editing enzyme YbaK/EbsC (Cys-tRNA(Pro) deacylase)
MTERTDSDRWISSATPLPGYAFTELDSPVVSCEQAANAKGIPLQRELKSLALDTSKGLVVAHVPGDCQISLRAAKRALGAAEARLANAGQLVALGAGPGTVTPFLSQLWPLPQLVDQTLLSLSWVSSNAGHLSRYIVFDPILLLRATRAMLVDIAMTSPCEGPRG